MSTSTVPAAASWRGDEAQRDQRRPTRAPAGRWPDWPRPPPPGPARRRRASRTVAPTSSCTHSAPGTSSGSASSSTPRRRSAAVAVADALELHDEAVARRTAATTRRGACRAAEASTVPGLRRCVWSVQSWTTTSPRRPWALATRPTVSSSVVDDVHAGLDAVLGARHVDQGPDGLGGAAPAADHPAHVVGGHVQVEAQARCGAPRCR